MRSPLRRSAKAWVLVGGLVCAVVLSWVTEGLADSTAITETALLLAIIVCVTSVVWWPAGAVTSVAAGLALNWAHTEPRHSLRISSAGDVVVVVLLTLLGPGVALLVRVRERDGRRAALGAVESSGSAGLVDAERTAVPALGLWHGTLDAVGSPLLDLEARLTASDDPTTVDLPVIARGARLVGQPGDVPSVVLPRTGAVMHFTDPRLDRVLVLTPRPGATATEVDRATLFSFRDHVEATLLRASQT